MAINMQGSWTVRVKSKSAAFAQRFVISGASSGNGTHAGNTGTPAVAVTGSAWAITIENDQGSGHWVASKDVITFPAVSGPNVQFDIRSDDAGGDLDFNDLVLTCSTAHTLEDFIVYGNVSYYTGFCRFNPCFRFSLVIDNLAGLLAALENPYLRVPIEKLYPDRVRAALAVPPRPLPDPPPFRPLVVSLREFNGSAAEIGARLDADSQFGVRLEKDRRRRGERPAGNARLGGRFVTHDSDFAGVRCRLGLRPCSGGRHSRPHLRPMRDGALAGSCPGFSGI